VGKRESAPGLLACGADGRSVTLADRVGDRPPVVAGIVAVAIGEAAMIVGLICVGLLLVHVIDGDWFGHWDADVNRWLAAHRTSTWNHITKVGTFMANTTPVVAVAVGAVVVMLVVRVWQGAVLIVVALFIEFSTFLATTYIVGRDRPDVPYLDPLPSTGSYPSGHTAATIVVWAGIALVVTACTTNAVARAVSWLLAVMATLLVGVARVYRGMHHVTDVVAGVALGVGALGFALLAVRTLDAAQRRRRVEVEPSPIVKAAVPAERRAG
jgi:membrane-associated phospholipid phosphatase